MSNKELLEELLSKESQEVQELFVQYVKTTKQYSRYINLIVNLSDLWLKEMEDKVVKIKAFSNAIQMVIQDYNIDKINWPIWARYLLATEDRETPSMNMVSPNELIKQLNQNMPKMSQNKPKNPKYNYLLEQFENIKQRYSIK
ncbi:MAG: hypothetical protein WCS56_02015 [Bacilli bacterium]